MASLRNSIEVESGLKSLRFIRKKKKFGSLKKKIYFCTWKRKVLFPQVEEPLKLIYQDGISYRKRHYGRGESTL